MKLNFLFITFALALGLNAQNVDDRTLFTVDGQNVIVQEFENQYNKNNFNNQADYSEESLSEYLNLYVIFRLKVREAENLGMDTVKVLMDELNMYRNQLVKKHRYDNKVTDALIAESYERMKKEVDVSHLLILWPNKNPSEADSTKVMNEITNIYNKANGSNFNDLALEYSDDPSAKDNKGRLGYLSAFRTVYPFETAMYETNVGQVSKPVATQFGYHLVYVHDSRPARGAMTTAHILIKSKETDVAPKKAADEKRAKDIYLQLKEGSIDFKEAVATYSDDKKTKYKNGVLPELPASKMLNTFADAAFALEKDGDIAAPVKTSIGWHIIKRINKKEMGSFEEMKDELTKRVERDARSNVAEQSMIADTKKDFGFKSNLYAKEEIINAMAKGFENNRFNISKEEVYNKSLFSIGDKTFTQNDFYQHVQKVFQRRSKEMELLPVLNNFFNRFEAENLIKYREDNLETINPDFKNLMQEYRDGILIFELMNKEVWNKAVEDTTGLKDFFAANRDKYMWEERVDYTTFTTENAKAAKKLKKFVAKGWAADKIASKLNKKENLVDVANYKFEKEANGINDDVVWEPGKVVEHTVVEEGVTSITVVHDVLAPMQKEMNETRGYVISDFQDHLEKEWIDGLQEKYEVVIDNKVYKSLIK